MKRRRLLQFLEDNGARFLREGGSHTIYHKPGTDFQTSVPRHREIQPFLVRKICKDLDIPPPREK